MSDSYVVLVTIGFRAAGRRSPGQLVRATLVFADGGGEERLGFNGEGRYLHDRADMKLRRRCWRAIKRSLSPRDSLRIDVFTGVRGAGEDTSLTGSWIYVVDPTAEVREVRIPGVGPEGFPLVKGRLVEVAAVTKRNQMDDELQQFLDDDSGM